MQDRYLKARVPRALYEALLAYAHRDRRFGRVHYATAADGYTDMLGLENGA